MSTIVLTPSEWRQIKEKIVSRHGQSVMLVSWRTKRELGFTVRTHTVCTRESPPGEKFPLYRVEETIRLDFYDGAAETAFRLTYL